LRELGFEVFDDWYAAGHEADDKWRDYEVARGHTYAEALEGFAARHVYEFDKHHLDRADIGVLALPAGKSGHLELGYLIGKGVPSFILFEDIPERYDVMNLFATENGGKICFNFGELQEALRKYTSVEPSTTSTASDSDETIWYDWDTKLPVVGLTSPPGNQKSYLVKSGG